MVYINSRESLKELEDDRWPIKKICGHNGDLCADTPLMVEWEDCMWNPKDAVINSIMEELICEHKDNLNCITDFMFNGKKLQVAKWKPSAIFIKDMHGDANHSRMRNYCRQNGLMFSLVYLYMT